MARSSLIAVTPIAPWPVRDGYTLRVAHLLECLAADWDITLLAPDGHFPPWLRAGVPVALNGAATVPWRFGDAPLRAGLSDILAAQRFDRGLVFAGAEGAWFDQRRAPPAILDLIDCNALEYWRAAGAADSLRAKAYWLRQLGIAALYARRGFRSCAATVVVAEADARWLRAMGGGAKVRVVPNGVVLPDTPPPMIQEPTLCLTGSLDYAPNSDAAVFAAHEIFPLVRTAIPDAGLLIAGRRPGPEVRALAELPGVLVTADVPDMKAIFASSTAALAPMRIGSGIKNKVLEAWACARPVVMTSIGAAGLAPPAAQGALIADKPAGLAERAVALLRDHARAAVLGAAARADVAQRFTWESQAERMGEILRNAAS